MKSLFLLRHAKSSWDDPSLADFDRPLAPRGRGAAPRMAAYMRKKGLVPDLVLCSAARRAHQTWELMAPILGGDAPVRTRRTLYGARPGSLLTALRRAPMGASSVLLIGHNPEIEDLALHLCGAGSKPKALARLRAKYPTAALAVIRFEDERWTTIAEGGGVLKRFVRPSDLG